MAESPKPSSWAKQFLSAAVMVALGAWLLVTAVQLLQRIAVVLIIGGVIVSVATVFIIWRRYVRSKPW